MNRRPAISAWLRCSPSKASTSASRPDTPAPSRADALLTGPSLPQIRSSPRPIRGYYGCRGSPAARRLAAGQMTHDGKEAAMGTAEVQGKLWGRDLQAWAGYQEAQMRPVYEATFGALEPLTGRALLDAGCGAGLAVRLAADRGAVVSGLDACAPLLEMARSRTPGRRPAGRRDPGAALRRRQLRRRHRVQLDPVRRRPGRGRRPAGPGLPPGRDGRHRRMGRSRPLRDRGAVRPAALARPAPARHARAAGDQRRRRGGEPAGEGGPRRHRR